MSGLGATDHAALAAGLLAGAALGAIWALLLWRAVGAALRARRPGPAAILLPAALRLLLVGGAAVLALRAGMGAPALLAGLAGFMLARLAATRLLPPPGRAVAGRPR